MLFVVCSCHVSLNGVLVYNSVDNGFNLDLLFCLPETLSYEWGGRGQQMGSRKVTATKSVTVTRK